MAKRSAIAAGLEENFVREGRVPVNGMSTTRTTLVLPVALDQNLEIFAVRSGMAKGEVIKKVLIDFLTKEGFQPDKRPKISIAY